MRFIHKLHIIIFKKYTTDTAGTLFNSLMIFSRLAQLFLGKINLLATLICELSVSNSSATLSVRPYWKRVRNSCARQLSFLSNRLICKIYSIPLYTCCSLRVFNTHSRSKKTVFETHFGNMLFQCYHSTVITSYIRNDY